MHLAILAVMVVLGILFVLPFIWMVIVTFEGQANIIPPVPPKYYIENPSLFNLKIVTENGQLLTSYINSFSWRFVPWRSICSACSWAGTPCPRAAFGARASS